MYIRADLNTDMPIINYIWQKVGIVSTYTWKNFVQMEVLSDRRVFVWASVGKLDKLRNDDSWHCVHSPT